MSKKKYIPNKGIKRPASFGSPVECIQWVKKSVYLIARGRIPDPKNPTKAVWVTIGTGCVVAPNRMITAAHVINNLKDQNDLSHHKHGDKYYLIKHDDEGRWHFRFFTPEMDKTMFLFPEVDLAILYLEDEFYQDGLNTYASKDDYIRIDQKFRPIGTETAVLGYPLCKLDFIAGNIFQPNIANILLRVDTGVINCRYLTNKDIYLYEFTVSFNPGNSGGPIFDWRTGQLLSIVHGFKAQAIKMNEHILTDNEKQKIGITKYQEDSFIETLHATYSIGYATPSFVEIFKKHGIIT